MCSQVYSVGVTAMDDNCTSNESSAEMLRTGEDEQESISVEVFCEYVYPLTVQLIPFI